MFATGSLLAQSRPSGTTAVEAFAATLRTEVSVIVVCNTTGSPVDFGIFHDDAGGSTFTQATALHYAQTIPGYSTVQIASEVLGGGIALDEDAQIGVQTSVASALTFSIYGITEDINLRVGR